MCIIGGTVRSVYKDQQHDLRVEWSNGVSFPSHGSFTYIRQFRDGGGNWSA